MKKFLKIFAFGLLGAIGFYLIYDKIFTKPVVTSYILENVTRGKISQIVVASGEIWAKSRVDLGAQVGGQVKEIFVNIGDNVKKGDLIALIDDIKQQNEIANLNANLSSLNAQLESKKISTDIAWSQYERQKKLFSADASSKEELENAKNSYKLAVSGQIAVQESINQVKISLNTAQTNLSYTKIIAPMDATVIAKQAQVGQTLNANQNAPTIVTLADLSQMEVKVEISEGDIVSIKKGQKVTFSILSSPQTYSALIDSIDPASTTYSDDSGKNSVSNTSQDNKAVYYYAKYFVPNLEGKFRIGMTTQNEILIQEVEDALKIPSITVHDEGEKKFVNLYIDENNIQKRYVKTALDNGVFVQVIDGLAENDRVVSGQMSEAEIQKAAKNTRMGRPRI